MHFDFDHAVALTGFAATAFDVELKNGLRCNRVLWRLARSKTNRVSV
jgi:hypothetical protein